jgi:hypothetical protein
VCVSTPTPTVGSTNRAWCKGSKDAHSVVAGRAVRERTSSLELQSAVVSRDSTMATSTPGAATMLGMR